MKPVVGQSNSSGYVVFMDWQETTALAIVLAVVVAGAVSRFRKPRLGQAKPRCFSCGGASQAGARQHLVIQGRRHERPTIRLKNS